MNLERLIVPGLIIIALTGILYRVTRPAEAPVSETTGTQNKEALPSTLQLGMLSTAGTDDYRFLPCGTPEREARYVEFSTEEAKQAIAQTYAQATSQRIPGTPILVELSVIDEYQETSAYTEQIPHVIVSDIASLLVHETCQRDSIVLTTPLSGATVASPITIQGQATGNWLFEGSMQAILTDGNGEIISTTTLTAQEDWMTSQKVSFSGIMEYDTSNSPLGHLIIEGSNPSGLPENALYYEIRVRLSGE